MNYFFTFFLQNELPFALLLGSMWSYSSQIKIKRVIWLSVLSFFVGALFILNLPNKQTILLGLNIFLLLSFILFYANIFLYIEKLRYFWHCVLLFIAGIYWGKDPNIVAITQTDVINTDFILNISAIVLAIFLCLFLVAWLVVLIQQSKTQQKLTALPKWIITIILLLLLTPLCGDILLNLMKLQQIELTKVRLSFVAKSGSLTQYFNYLHSIILLSCIILFFSRVHLLRKLTFNNETHPIEKRKKLSILLTSQRLILWGIFAILIIVGSQLYWDKIASQPPQLSAATPVTLDHNNQIHIPIEQVSDGKLHRFVWIADDGKAVRFFLINRLSDRLSLAAVFDACILCGDQGYVMEGDQVVCVGCGVRMFIPSIGKPGGCNPVPIENWQQTENYVVLSKKNLEDGLNYFSTIVEIDVIDPVDQSKLKNTQTEHKYSYEGKTYFFANESNLNSFRDAPENYIKQQEGK
ncbi:Fe-S-containing protein [Pasteurella dagmatis]|uniref:YHS domain protein n=1 Tax=Pasteurella dagmatis ATCC 43325 TaxID=667128 RepID=C9PQA2_9PAST|nr:Fe-S-containing protein [Pasteurella dagmatis]EEX50213.1 YHS domain protein [Pasteurella dagmatis ATCC 43325]SNV58774.1 YHS family protein [Pasteurella dagmatis]